MNKQENIRTNRDIVHDFVTHIENEQIRLMCFLWSRGYSDEKVDKILASQLKDEIFAANADFIIDNSDNLEKTYHQIDELLSK